MKLFRSKKALTIGVAAAMTVGIAGGAFAYFTSTGAGTGSATVGVSSALDIAQTGSVTALVPDSPAQAIHYTVTNNTSAAEKVGSVTVSISSITGAGTNNTIEACTPSLFTLTQDSALNATIAAGNNVSDNGLASIRLTDDGNNQDNCQGATVHLAFSSN